MTKNNAKKLQNAVMDCEKFDKAFNNLIKEPRFQKQSKKKLVKELTK